MSHRLFYHPALAPGENTLSEEESRHALASLRLHEGQSITLFDGRGRLATGSLRLGSDSAPHAKGGRKHGTHGMPRVRVEIEQVVQVPKPARQLMLVVAACKGPRLTWMIEKCTELGVTRIALTDFERSVVKVGSRQLEKLRRTAIEACKQCGRAWLPDVEHESSFAAVLQARRSGPLLYADASETAVAFLSWLNARGASAKELTAAVGPEGGLTPSEVECLSKAGAAPVRLAEHVLRVETAALSLAATWAAFA